MTIASERELELFVFPLPHVSLFSKTSKPLNVFEPRYVAMVNDALEQSKMIALAYTDPGLGTEGPALAHVRAVVGYGTVELFERRPDQTMLILLKGVGKAKLLSRVSGDKPYIVAKAAPIMEMMELDPSQVFLLNRLMRKFRTRIESHMTDAKERELFWGRLRTPEEKLNSYCAMMVEEPEQRQKLLEADSISERLSLAALMLDADSTSH